jgi:mRNA-degrading endonuclease RelE of RelBE toxin-antitoxin system
MGYTVELQTTAERQFDRLPTELKRSVLRALRSLETDARRLVLVCRIAPRDKAYRG